MMDEKTNVQLESLVNELRVLAAKEKAMIWKKVADELSRPRRRMVEASIAKINKHIREGETALVPGKVLSNGEITKKINVAAFKFSEKAREKISKNGKAITIRELMKNGAKGKKIRVIC
ncbi:50S ribosomal protein L18e [Candidatus Woesearchaeota archaeon]|nr:50S ribosomal protein L18e [Candidatus Woesearchaeota archaeon]